MAAKVKMLKLLQEIRGFAQVTNRRPPPRSPAMLLAQFRSQAAPEARHRRKHNITVNTPNRTEIPSQVKIHHLNQNPDPPATLPAP